MIRKETDMPPTETLDPVRRFTVQPTAEEERAMRWRTGKYAE